MDLSQSPLPSHAISIYTDGNNIILKIPQVLENDRSHNLILPLEKCGIETSDFGEPLLSQRGWYVVLQILQDRARQTEPALIGTKAAPIQHSVDLILKAIKDGKVRRVGRKTKADDNLTLDDLDI